MRSILRTAVVAATSLTAMAFDSSTNTDGQDPDDISGGLTMRTPTDLGCYSNPGKMVDMGVYDFQSTGWCHPLCVRLSMNYFALNNGTNCWCGSSPPIAKSKVDSDECNQPCSGFKDAKCGGTNLWEMYDGLYRVGDPTGTQKITIPSQTYTFPSSAAATTSSVSSSTGPATVVITQEPTAIPTPTNTPAPASGTNTAAIVAGVVVSIVVVAAVIGGVFFFMRRRKQQALAEEQRRHEMMTNFVTAEKPGSGYTSPDARLDPSLMFQRRLSDGSIRDNEDYSRRILKVANPDD